MDNPFYIQPASPLPGIKEFNSRLEFERGRTEDARKKEVRKKVADIIKNGNPEEIAEIVTNEPWVTGEIDKGNALLKDISLENAKRILSGEISPGQGFINIAEEEAKNGQDISKAIPKIKDAQRDPEAAMAWAEKYIALHDPDAWKEYRKSQGKTEEEKPPSGYRYKEDGTLEAIPGGPADKGEPPFPGMQPGEKAPAGYYWEEKNKLAPIPGGPADKEGGRYAPSNLQKLIEERQEYLDKGMSPDDRIIKAYDSKISGTDIEIDNMSPEEIDTWGQIVNLTGKMPALGMGKKAAQVRIQIARSAARQALDAASLIPGADPSKKPSEAALEVIGTQADTKAVSGAITFLQKQASSMGSFVNNIEQQIDKVQVLSKDLKSYDSRLLNIPLRTLRGKIAGSALQSKYDLYLAEIESEIGKLATGSTASIAELSVTAQQRWEKIHDKNLSIKDMLSLLDETKAAARMRMKSVDDELEKTRRKMRTRGIVPENSDTQKNGADRGNTSRQPSAANSKGWKLMHDAAGNKAYVSPDGTQFEEVP